MNEVDQAKLLAALLGVLKKENSKAKKALAEELSQELQDLIDDQSGTQYLQIDELEQPVPIQVFRGEKGEQGKRGLKGQKGARGEKGQRGLTGPEGPQGLPGETGPMGPQGIRGPEGQVGPEGRPGKDGKTPDIEPFKDKISKDFDTFTRNISSQITRMAYAGGSGGGASSPGSGEVRLLRLDDVDPDNLGDKHYLRYNSDTEKLEFVNVLTSDNLQADQIQANTINVSVFVNDSNYASRGYVTQAIANLVYTAPDALDTIWELAAAINDNPNFGAQVLTSLSLKANTADLSTVALTGSYNDLLNLPNLDQYLTVSNSNVFALSTDLDNYLTVANSNIFTTKSESIAANNALIARMDRYIEVANANLLIQDKVDKYLEVANTGSLVLRPELDNYIQVANANLLIQDKVDKYLQVSNANFTTQADLDRYLEVANANSVSPDELSQYLQVANSTIFATQADLDRYLEVANVNSVTSDQLDNYLQVANANFITAANNLGSGIALSTGQLNSVLQLRTVVQGSGISITSNNDVLQISSTVSAGAAGEFDYGLITVAVDSSYDYGSII